DRVHHIAHRGDYGPFLLQLARIFYGTHSLLDEPEPRHRNGLPPAADTSVLSAGEVDRVLSGGLRRAGPGRWSHFLGRDTSHPPPLLRQGRRSPHAQRR